MFKRWSTLSAVVFVAILSTIAACTLHWPQGGRGQDSRFDPKSLSFVSDRVGWAIGQMSPCSDEGGCPILQHTVDGANKWTPIETVGFPPGAESIKFYDSHTGSLTTDDTNSVWITRDGGLSWASTSLPFADDGIRVQHLGDPRGSDVLAAILRLTEGGTVDLFVMKADGDQWHRVGGVSLWNSMRSGDARLLTAIHGTSAWIWSTHREHTPAEVSSNSRAGARIVGGQIFPWSPPCTAVDERPTSAVAASDMELYVACARDRRGMRPYIARSQDGGLTFTHWHEVPETQLDLLAAFVPDKIVSAQSGSIHYSTTESIRWQSAVSDWNPKAIKWIAGLPGAVTNSFGVVVMTENYNFESLRPASPLQSTALISHDSGETWRRIDFATPAADK
ncbi:hypothetical protein [Nocardia mangyaensis]|nr:hypothetical protein [Nocardia mangyaensis]